MGSATNVGFTKQGSLPVFFQREASPLILAVADNALVRTQLRQALTQSGYAVIEAANGTAALQLYRQQHPDLVLLPELQSTPDSFTVCSEIRATAPSHAIPILMILPAAAAESIDRAFAAGATHFIAAPLEFDLLPQQLRYALRIGALVRDLEHSRNQLQRTQNLAQIGHWSYDVGSGVMHWSEEIFRLGELDPTIRPSLKLVRRLLHPADRPRLKHYLNRIFLGRETQPIECRILLADGSERSITVMAELSRDLRRKPYCLFGIAQDISERKRIEARLSYLAQHDSLTGLPNWTWLRSRLYQATLDASQGNGLVGILSISLDRFKLINDTLGHEVGDRLLKAAAGRLRECVRGSDTISRRRHDTVTRRDGAEFSVLVTALRQPDELAGLACRILESFARAFTIADHELYISPSIGIAVYPLDGDSANRLLRNADVAMERASQLGGNMYQYYTLDMNARAAEQLSLETALRRALEREEFRLHYQPQLALATGTISSVEALLRWSPPASNLVYPRTFIPLLETTGQISPVGEWVLRSACLQAAAWRQAGLPPLGIAVNLSGRQFNAPAFMETVLAILDETAIPPADLILEITESVVMDNIEHAITILGQLRTLGVQLAIDDFGTGYSSLAYLRRLPVNILKIDRSFIQGMSRSPHDAAIVRAVISMAKSLALQVVAEGVEDASTYTLLAGLGCDLLQGYYISKPRPAAELTHWLNRLPPGR